MIRTLWIGAAASLALAGAATAQTPAADAIRARQTHYKEIGAAAKTVRDELAKPQPSLPPIQDAAHRIAVFAPQIYAWFPKGSGSEAGLKTSAREEIWAKPEAFKHAVDDFVGKSHAFEVAARGGDLAAIRNANQALGDSCKSCHQDFRVREH